MALVATRNVDLLKIWETGARSAQSQVSPKRNIQKVDGRLLFDNRLLFDECLLFDDGYRIVLAN